MVCPHCAIGDREAEVATNVSQNSVSSSIHSILTLHRTTEPRSRYVRLEAVRMHRLDEVASNHIAGARVPLLKIDTQGYEWQMLDGAMVSLPRIQAIMIDLSLVPLYETQRLWLETVDRLKTAGFELWSLRPVFTDPGSGRTLQVDGLFCRRAVTVESAGRLLGESVSRRS